MADNPVQMRVLVYPAAGPGPLGAPDGDPQMHRQMGGGERPMEGGVRQIDGDDQLAGDGDQEQVFYFAAGGQRLRKAIRELEQNLHAPPGAHAATQNIEDTLVLWSAWKRSVVDSVNAIFEDRVRLVRQRMSGEDDSGTRETMRQLLSQIHNTMRLWRDHQQFLRAQQEELGVANAHFQSSVRESRTALDRQLRDLQVNAAGSRGLARANVAMNTAVSVEQTRQERRALTQKTRAADVIEHVELIHALQRGMGQLCTSFERDVSGLATETSAALAALEASVRAKNTEWRERCDALQAEYDNRVHRPLRELLREHRATGHALRPGADAGVASGRNADAGNDAGSDADDALDEGPERHVPFDLISAALDNQNDPHCVRRCDLALQELLAMRATLGSVEMAPRADASRAWEDDTLRAARGQREAEAARADEHAAERVAALQEDCRALNRTLQAARQRLRALKDRSQQVQAGTARQMQQHNVAEPQAHRRAALITRAASTQLENLAADVAQTRQQIARHEAELQAIRQRLSGGDRVHIVQALATQVAKVYDTCREMREQFRQAIGQEEALRRMLTEQFAESARRLQADTVCVMHRMCELTQSRMNALRVRLAASEDVIDESTRRIEALEHARRGLQQRSEGPEIPMVAALEEHMELARKASDSGDLATRASVMCDVCDRALAVMTGMCNDLQVY